MPKRGDLRVWRVPQIPMKAFYVPVKTLDEAGLIMDTLAQYDLFQLENNGEPHYSTAGGVQTFDKDGEWAEWYSEDGDDFDTWWDENRDKTPILLL